MMMMTIVAAVVGGEWQVLVGQRKKVMGTMPAVLIEHMIQP